MNVLRYPGSDAIRDSEKIAKKREIGSEAKMKVFPALSLTGIAIPESMN